MRLTCGRGQASIMVVINVMKSILITLSQNGMPEWLG